MHAAVTISLVPEARGGPFVFWDDLAEGCRRAADAGFDAVEVFPRAASSLDAGVLRALLEKHRLRLAAMGTGGGWVVHKLTLTHPDAAVRRDAREFIRAIIDFAGRLQAPAIIGSMQGRWEGAVTRDHALTWLAEGLADLGAHAKRHGVPLLYEPLNRYETNMFNRLGDTAAWLRSIPTDNVRILADLYHMNIEEADLPAAIHEAGAMIGHVHFADSNRRAIGFGHTDVAPIIGALRAIGYDRYLSAEILPLPDAAAAAGQTIAAFRKFACSKPL
ncbi:MAG TPA: sugar phosphate isomerase/epimerase family protein [Opitutaceae bacterium]|nr:sugar phosphate isomerase/epimerase family protein [Opitutaceae bacterium]